jgi:predicted nucleic acid-binding protein
VAIAIVPDTNAVSVLFKLSAVHQPRLDALRSELSGRIAFVSFVTVAELLFWAEEKGWGQKRRYEMDERLRAFGILESTRETAEIWASTKATAKASGNILSAHDLWIAAACLEHDLPLISNDGAFDAIPRINRRSI